MPIPTRLMLSLTLLALLSGCVSSSGTRAKSGSDGWKTLFDGKTFAGWRGYRMKAMPAKGWRIEDGILKKVGGEQDRKSTRLNSSHSQISYAVFCLKKKN